MKRMLLLFLGTVLLAGLATAHGDEQHVMGTVTKITDTAITVDVSHKEGDSQTGSVTVLVVSSTKFLRTGGAATFKDLRVGDRVVIHAAKKGDQLEAHVVKIGAVPKGVKHE